MNPAMSVGASRKDRLHLLQTGQRYRGRRYRGRRHSISISPLVALLKNAVLGQPLATQPLQKHLASCSCWKAELVIQEHILQMPKV